MKAYIDVAKRIINEGVWVENERTGKRCKTIINVDMTYDVGANEFPIVTTRKSYYKQAIMEMLGYIRGYSSAEQFRAIGCNTWNANANENKAWLNNPNRKGADDMGRVYGVQGREWLRPDGKTHDQFRKVIDNLSKGIDDRGEIITFYNPGEIDLGCLRPCMHTHTFSILDGTVYLTSYQRSADLALGINFNVCQVFFLLAVVAQITGLKPGKAYHKIVNAHIYEDQYSLMSEVEVNREPFAAPTFHMNPDITSLEDLETWVTADDFWVEGYQHHEPIKYPFSV